MTDEAVVGNSRILGVFDQVLHDPASGLRAVEIAGRGIAAEARCSLAVLADKRKRYDDSPEAAMQRVIAASDQLMLRGEIEDDLVEVWRSRSGDAAFEQSLNEIVVRLDAWAQHWIETTPANG